GVLQRRRDSPRGPRLRRPGRRPARRRRRRARLHDSRRAERAAVPAWHGGDGARLEGHRRQPVLHHALTAAASRRALYGVRPRRERHRDRRSYPAVGRDSPRADLGREDASVIPHVDSTIRRFSNRQSKKKGDARASPFLRTAKLSLLRRLLLTAFSLLRHRGCPPFTGWIAGSGLLPAHSAAWHVGPA